jgi:PAS domain S-box-containing protein
MSQTSPAAFLHTNFPAGEENGGSGALPEPQVADLKSSLEQIRYQALLLNNVRDAVVVWEPGGAITYMNPAAQFLFGWGQDDWRGMPVAIYLNSFVPPVLEPRREGTGGLRRERQFVRPGRPPIWVSSHVYALRDPGISRLLIGYMDVCRDITENKEMEARMQVVQTRLIHAARLAAIGELASGVAHQVNNPLTTIIAEAQILLNALPPDHPARESASAIEAAGWRVQKAVQRLLDFSQPAADMIEVLDVNETVVSALDLVGDQIRAGGAHLQVELAAGLPRIQGNVRLLVELWLNLLMLAHWSSVDDQSHEIKIRSLAAPENTVWVEVSDNGAPAHQGRAGTLFDPVIAQTPYGRGTGVELALCREIVRKHGGQITAECSSNGVTILRVALPGV